MSIVAMKKLKLIAVQSQKDDILKDLMLLGCVQIEEPKIEEDDEEGAAAKPVKVNVSKLLELRAQSSTISNALARLNKYSPYKKGLLTPFPEVKLDEVLNEDAISKDLEMAENIIELDNAIRDITSQENKEKATITAMEPWLDMNQDLGQSGTVCCDIMYATIPMEHSLDEARGMLSDYCADITLVSEGIMYHFVSIVYYKGLAEDIVNTLKPAGLVPIVMTGYSGTPKEVSANANKALEELAKSKQEKTAAIIAAAENRKDLQLGLEILQTMIDRAEAGDKSLLTRSTFTIEGWLTAPDEEKLNEVLGKYTCAWETEDPDKEEIQERKVPVKLKNNKVTRPYNLITEMYSLPAYNGLDPNPFLMPFFSLFFGIMFADMAYGLILLTAGIIWRKKGNPRGSMGYMCGLIKQCGITTLIFGFLTGGFFGDLVTIVGQWFGADIALVPTFATFTVAGNEISLPLNLTTGNNPLYVLIFAIILGAIHLFLGTLIGCYLKIRDGEWADAVFNDFSWWIIIAGLLMMVLGMSPIVLYVGLVMMVLGSLITNKGFGKITGIVSAIYNGATGYLGDFLSYSRLMALMLAGSVIASVFNQLGSLGNTNGPTIFGTILFIVVFLIGHVLNFLLNVIGCFVHSLRLQYLEFFGKWYRDGGRPFRPLGIKTKYFEITKEEQ